LNPSAGLSAGRRPALGAALLLAAAAAAAASPDLDQVRELLRKGDRAKALEVSRAVLQESPDDVEAHLLYQDAARGQIPAAALVEEYRVRHEGKPGPEGLFLWARLLPPAEAEKALKDPKADAKSYWVQAGMATVLARLGKAAAAEQAALAALETRAGDARAAIRAGDQCAAARRWTAAEACYRRAADGGAPGPAARLGLAHALLRLGRLEDAAAVLGGLKQEGKPDARVLLLEAALAGEKGDAVAAERALVQVATLDPADQDAAVQLALLRIRKAEAAARAAGKPVEAKALAAEIATLEKATAALPDRADVRYALGFAREIAGDADQALAEYREATRVDPLDGAAYSAAGAILAAKGALEDAAGEFQKAVDRDPDDPAVLFQLGVVLDLQGKTKEATAAYQKVVKAKPGNARAWHALGLALEGAGRAQEALPAFVKAVEAGPTVGRYHRDLGEAYFQRRAYDKAEAALSKAVEIDPKDDLAWMALGRTRTQGRKYEKGAEAYEKAAELRPKDMALQILLGAYHHEYLKNYAQAIKHYNKYVQLGGDSGDIETWLAEAEAEVNKDSGKK
jgi:tetratricopeptide (TPR) repeat protein